MQQDKEKPDKTSSQNHNAQPIVAPDLVLSILFGLVLVVGFLVFQDEVGFEFSFALVMFITTYYIIIYDWIGYNNLIKQFPYKNHISRFVLDIVIFFVFFLLFVSTNYFERYLLILPSFFLIVPIWDELALRQYKHKSDVEKERLRKGRKIGLIAFIVFLLIALLYKYSCIHDYKITKWIIVLMIWIAFTSLLMRFNVKL